MPRANRIRLEGQVWHLTHRCHKQQWLLRFIKDRVRWLFWLYQARKRFGLVVLNYVVTSNHIHLLVQDQGRCEIAKSMQLIAGRTAQEYNNRKNRHGAFWEDRYHATAVESDHHLWRCMAYIDLNMVRAGAVTHPSHWAWSGYHELRFPKLRGARLDVPTLLQLLNVSSISELTYSLDLAVIEAIEAQSLERDPIWSASAAVGSEAFVEQHRQNLKRQHPGLNKKPESDTFALAEEALRYRPVFQPKNAR